jgi:hypothetical protein
LIKYPRTPHLPYSPGFDVTDEMIVSDDSFVGDEVVVMEKMDGENTTIYNDGTFHARSVDSRGAPWRSWVAREAARLSSYNVQSGWRICGENMFARHSIGYDDLKSFFLCFSIWDEEYCHPWGQTVEFMRMLELERPATIYHGTYDREKILTNFESYRKDIGREVEGFVVRRTHGFFQSSFDLNVAKWVREDHVKTDGRWEDCWTENHLRGEL